jgi:polyhydroxybutyrate depolymerase
MNGLHRHPTNWIGLLALLLGLTPNAGFPADEERFEERTMLVHVPASLPPWGSRALVVVLHGGLGNPLRIESNRNEHGLNMDGVSDEAGFIVAYLSGTPVTRFLGADKLGWNAGGGCCGQSAANEIDDVGYITRAVTELATRYGIDRTRVFAIGHSNGAMMAQRLECETGLFAAIVAVSGPLNLESSACHGARGRRVLAIHGELDTNVPIAGGRGSGLARATFQSEAHAQALFTRGGGDYRLQIVEGADHNLDRIQQAIERSEGRSLAHKAAQFFGLADATH